MCGAFVEDCLRLDVYDVLENTGVPLGSQAGALRWLAPGGEVLSAAGFRLRWLSPNAGELILAYAPHPETVDPIRLRINLIHTRPGFGGQRWWFQCPLGTEGAPCENRARVLYLPPLSRHFGCRDCHTLQYRSQYWAPRS